MPRGVYERAERARCSIAECGGQHLALGLCRKHYRAQQRHGDPLVRKQPLPVGDADGPRVCTACATSKSLDDFPPDSRNANGRKRRCRACTRAYVREWAQRDVQARSQVQHRARWRRRAGEAGVAAYDRMINGCVCDACGVRRSRMAVDHCHITGQVRGVLCAPCNTALGLLAESRKRADQLFSYLERADG